MRVAKHSEREGAGAEGVSQSRGGVRGRGHLSSWGWGEHEGEAGMEWVVWLNIPDAGVSLKPHRLKKKSVTHLSE